MSNDRVLRSLLDGRDTDDIPTFSKLADRPAPFAGLIAKTPAHSSADLIAKARCARLHPTERGLDAATELGLSVADDVLRIDDPADLPPF